MIIHVVGYKLLIGQIRHVKILDRHASTPVGNWNWTGIWIQSVSETLEVV